MGRWALVTHPEHLALATRGTFMLPMQILERDLHWALGQGWIVLARDTGLYDDRTLKVLTPVEMPLQSNPRRVAEDREDGSIDGE